MTRGKELAGLTEKKEQESSSKRAKEMNKASSQARNVNVFRCKDWDKDIWYQEDIYFSTGVKYEFYTN